MELFNGLGLLLRAPPPSEFHFFGTVKKRTVTAGRSSEHGVSQALFGGFGVLFPKGKW